jgi:hypothetical protein
MMIQYGDVLNVKLIFIKKQKCSAFMSITNIEAVLS